MMTKWTTDIDIFTGGPGQQGSGPKASGYRTCDTYTGGRLEVESYPFWDTRPASGVRARKLKPCREAQRKQNTKNSKKRFCHLLDANFGPGDIYFTGTYDNSRGPLPGLDQVRRDMRNFIARIQRERTRRGLPKARYMYVIEGAEAGSKQIRIHVHLVISGGLPRDCLESMWRFGRARADRLQPDDYGLLGLGKYLSKDPKGKKRWGASRGLTQPRVELSDRKLTRRMVAAIERDRYAAREIVAKLYPGYMLRDPEADVTVRTSPYVSGAYVSMVLTRIDNKPKNPRRRM